MSAFTTAVIVGSLRKDSFNLKLAKALIKAAQGKFEGKISRIDDLPLFNQDLESAFPASATRLKSDISSADAVLVVTPEYNRSIPGPLKNAIDWASRPYGKNAFAGKPLGILGTSPGAIGTACSQASLKPIFVYLDTHLMGQPEAYIQFKDGLIDNDGHVTNEETQKFLNTYIDHFVSWVNIHLKDGQKKIA